MRVSFPRILSLQQKSRDVVRNFLVSNLESFEGLYQTSIVEFFLQKQLSR